MREQNAPQFRGPIEDRNIIPASRSIFLYAQRINTARPQPVQYGPWDMLVEVKG